jgi:TRAP-type C4-dicarboxylate transport system substrate-binding protein
MSAVIPELDVLEIPFRFDSSEEADYVLDNYLWKPFEKLFAEKEFIEFKNN